MNNVILHDIEIEEDIFTVYIDVSAGTALAEGCDHSLSYTFQKTPAELTEEEQVDILKYRFGNNYKQAGAVRYEDIFMHGGFMRLVSKQVKLDAKA